VGTCISFPLIQFDDDVRLFCHRIKFFCKCLSNSLPADRLYASWHEINEVRMAFSVKNSMKN